ncbi:MAG: thioredoxin family protein [Planctomycetaceae bacterium]|jgi:thioredoxin-like negative regulator of GroEL|nr:thioredoxin family protein [Planctomycetaceae bacterium]
MDRRRFLAASATLALTAAARPGFAGPFNQAAPKIEWQTDLKAAYRLAVRDDKPILIVFGASWCTFCHKLDRETFADRRMVEFVQSSFIPVHLDFDKEPHAAKVLEVEQLPASVVLSPEADLLKRTIGYYKYEKYREELDLALAEGAKIRQVRGTKR